MENIQDEEMLLEDENLISTDCFQLAPTEEIGEAIIERVRDHITNTIENGLRAKWKKNYSAYYSNDYKEFYNNKIKLPGVKHTENMIFTNENYVTPAIKSILGILNSTPPKFKVVSNNTSFKSTSMIGIVENLVKHGMESERINLKYHITKYQELGFIFGSGYLLQEFDNTLDNGDNQPMGDVKVSTPTVFDLTFNIESETFTDLDWVIVRQFHNKASLLKLFPDLRHKIENGTTKASYRHNMNDDDPTILYVNKSDLILTYKLFHKKTNYLPDGRFTWVLSDGTVLTDMQLPYSRLPIECFQPWKRGSYGETPLSILLALQEELDILTSSVCTNQSTLGLSIVTKPVGVKLEAADIGTGIIYMDLPIGAEAPKPLQLLNTPAEIFSNIERLKSTITTFSGLSDVVRGSAPAGMSGSAMALSASTTSQNQAPIINESLQSMARAATIFVEIYKIHATEKRILNITGENTLKTQFFNNEDLSSFEKLEVQPNNPLSNTVAGRMELAAQLAASGNITPQQQLTIIQTGNLDEGFIGITNETELVKGENTLMLEGKAPMVLVTDDHDYHIQIHNTILNNPDYRLASNIESDPQLKNMLEVVVKHVQEHMMHKKGLDPNSQTVPTQQQQPQNNNQPESLLPDPTNYESTIGPNDNSKILAESGNTQLPNMPTNPIDGTKTLINKPNSTPLTSGAGF